MSVSYLSVFPEENTDKVDLYALNGTGPAIEPEHFVGEIDAFLCCEIVYLLPGGTRSRRDVFGTELFIKS